MVTDKVVVVTGASDGIGAAAARALADNGHQVVLVGRSPDKTARIAGELGVDSYVADYSRLDTVRALAAALLKYPRIDVLANNAGGVFGNPRQLTADGHEITFQVNYLAPFLLTNLLLARLIDSKATVINTSSSGNRTGRVELHNLQGEKRYSALRAYYNAKLEQILFTRELNRRYGSQGLTGVAFNPGTVRTNFSQGENAGLRWVVNNPLIQVMFISPEKGADTLVYLAEGTPGLDFAADAYFVKRKIARVNKQAYDDRLAAELWDQSMAMCLQ
jgi:NAD(P)-dependent dehydrogenase (short-subunit alcohol dehydrogenase family)